MSYDFTDVMLDMETFALGPRATVISLALVAFRPMEDQVGPYLFRAVDRAEQADLGREVDQDTVSWWSRQSPEARAQLDMPGLSVADTLTAVRYFIEDNCVSEEHVRIWSCGASFDCVILATLHRDVRARQPWRFYNERCYRTLKELFPAQYKAACELLPRAGKHDALQDAMWQAKIAQHIYRTGPR